MCGKIRGVEGDSWLAVRIETKYFCGRAARGVERALGIEVQGPQIRSIRIREQSELGSEFEAAVAAHRDAMSGALEELFVSRLAPAAGVLGERRGEAKEAKEVNEVKDSE